MFSPICIGRVRPLNVDERVSSEKMRKKVDDTRRRRSGSTHSGRQLGCVRQQADTVLALVTSDVVSTTRGETLAKHEFQLDGCYVPEVIDYRLARRPSMYGPADAVTSSSVKDPAVRQQEQLFTEVMVPLLQKAVKEGLLATVIATGAKQSGKSFTIFGTQSAPGLLHQSVAALLRNNTNVKVELSVVEVYDERIQDLLNPSAVDKKLRLRPTKHRGICAEGAKRLRLERLNDAQQWIAEARELRSLGGDCPDVHARQGHLLVTLYIWVPGAGSSIAYSELTFVDAAASQFKDGSCASAWEKYSLDVERIMLNSSVHKGLNTLHKCLDQLGDMSHDYNVGVISQLPIGESVLTSILGASLSGKQQLVVVGCISPSPDSLVTSVGTLARLAKLRYARFPVNPKPVDPNVLLVQLITDDLTDVKQQLKTLETSKKAISGRGESKAVLLQRLVELTEAFQEATQSDDEKRSKQKHFLLQRSRALAKLETSHAIPTDTSVPRLKYLGSVVAASTSSSTSLPSAATMALKEWTYLYDGDTWIGGSPSCTLNLSQLQSSVSASDDTLRKMQLELDAFLDGGHPLAATEGRREEDAISVDAEDLLLSPMHCLVAVSELEHMCYITMPQEVDEGRRELADCETTKKRKIFVNGRVMLPGDPNRTLHHLDRVLIAGYAFQVILPTQWLRDRQERKLLRKKKTVPCTVACELCDGAIPPHLQPLREKVSHLLNERLWLDAGSTAPTADMMADVHLFSRQGRTAAHVELMEQYHRCSEELYRYDEVVEMFSNDPNALTPILRDVYELLAKRAAIGAALEREHPARSSGVDADGRPLLGLETAKLDPSVVYDAGFALQERAAGRSLDEDPLREDDRGSDSNDSHDENNEGRKLSETLVLSEMERDGPASRSRSKKDSLFEAVESVKKQRQEEVLPAAAETTALADGDIFDELDALIRKASPSFAPPPPSLPSSSSTAPHQSHVDPTEDGEDTSKQELMDGGVEAATARNRRRGSVFKRPAAVVLDEEEVEHDEDERDPEDEENTQQQLSDFPSTSLATQRDASSLGAQEATNGVASSLPLDSSSSPATTLLGSQSLSDAERQELLSRVTDEDSATVAKALESQLRKELLSFREELTDSMKWKPFGPAAKDKQDRAMYEAAVALNVHRKEIPASTIRIAGTIFKLRVQRSVFHRGGFYEVDAAIANRFLFYFDVSAKKKAIGSSEEEVPLSPTTPSPPASGKPTSDNTNKLGDACTGSCYLYGATVEVLAVGDMKYCIQVTATCPRKPSKAKQHDSSENRVILGFATRALQQEWYDKLRMASLPTIPDQWEKYFGKDAAKYLVAVDNRNDVTGSAHATDTAASAKLKDDVLRSVQAIAHLKIGQTSVVAGQLPVDIERVRAEANKWSDPSLQNAIHTAVESCSTASTTASSVNCPVSATEALHQILTQQASTAPEEDAVLRAEASKLFHVAPIDAYDAPQLAQNASPASAASAAAVMDNAHAANSLYAKNPSSILPLKQVHNHRYLKHYFRTTPVVVMGDASNVFVHVEFDLADDLARENILDGNITASMLQLFDEARRTHAPLPRLAGTSDPHFVYIDHFKGTIEWVDPRTKRAAVFYGRELLRVSLSQQDPLVALITMFHVKPYLYVERFSTYEERQQFMDSAQLLRRTQRHCAPWLLPIHAQLQWSRKPSSIVQCNVVIDGVGTESVTIPKSSNSAVLKLEGEVHVAVTTATMATATLWIGSWNLGGVPLHSDRAIQTWTELHVIGSEDDENTRKWSGADIAVFSLQLVGGMQHAADEPGNGPVPPVNGFAERVAAAMTASQQKRARSTKSTSFSGVYRVLKAISNAAGDVLLVIAKDFIDVQVSNIASQVMSPTLGSVAVAEGGGAALAISMCVGRSSLCVLGVRLPSTQCTPAESSKPKQQKSAAASATRAFANDIKKLRQVMLADFLSQVRHGGDLSIDGASGFDVFLLTGDLAEGVGSGRMQQVETDGISWRHTAQLSEALRQGLHHFGEPAITFPPTCPVVLGTRGIPRVCMGEEAAPPPAAAVRELSYSGRVLFRDNVTARGGGATSMQPLLYLSCDLIKGSSPAQQQAVDKVLLITETLPVSLLATFSFSRSAPLLFSPSVSVSGGAVPHIRMIRVKMSFASASLHPSFVTTPRLQIVCAPSDSWLDVPTRVVAALPVRDPPFQRSITSATTAPTNQVEPVSYLWDLNSSTDGKPFPLRSKDRSVVSLVKMMLSLTWTSSTVGGGLSGRGACGAASTMWLQTLLTTTSSDGASAPTTLVLPLERAGRLLGTTTIECVVEGL